MKVILVTLVLLAVTDVVAQSAGAKYINYRYKSILPGKTLPNGVKHLGGGLIGDINADPVYGISQVNAGRARMFWLEVSTGQDSTGVTGWKVLDVVYFPTLQKTDYLLFSADPSIECERGGEPLSADANVVGVGTIVRRQGIFKPSRLWIADLISKKFEPVPIAGVKCSYSEP